MFRRRRNRTVAVAAAAAAAADGTIGLQHRERAGERASGRADDRRTVTSRLVAVMMVDSTSASPRQSTSTAPLKIERRAARTTY